MTPGEPPHSDPGLQPERTTQSWLRASLSLTVISLIFVRWIDVFGVLSIVAFVLCIGLVITAMTLQARRYRHGVQSMRDERGRPSPWAIIFLTTAVCLIALLGIASVIRITLG